jgi:hypothetical protein
MLHNRRTRLTAALIGGAAALAIGGLTAAPAGAASVTDSKFTLSLGAGNSATAKVCYTLNPSNLDVDENEQYTEKVEIWGDDQHDTVKSNDDFVVTLYSGSRTFNNTTPVTDICRKHKYSDRKDLNEDSGPGQDELYAKIKLVPIDPQLKTVSKRTNEVKTHL